MDRICGECENYVKGSLENPCSKGNRYCGYLREGMNCWEPDVKEEEEIPVKQKRRKVVKKSSATK